MRPARTGVSARSSCHGRPGGGPGGGGGRLVGGWASGRPRGVRRGCGVGALVRVSECLRRAVHDQIRSARRSGGSGGSGLWRHGVAGASTCLLWTLGAFGPIRGCGACSQRHTPLHPRPVPARSGPLWCDRDVSGASLSHRYGVAVLGRARRSASSDGTTTHLTHTPARAP
ncbi:hypothetical protein EXU48_00265 [Occultella glacieicola]|uniref:Uncharacterized protein n=1 Tax=Occultella glacieicola TaxID=2518684 RepID=A0ABY2E857_9MICO|nr:hypothetical protein EXU48_00265 [Occultella glacieicola]